MAGVPASTTALAGSQRRHYIDRTIHDSLNKRLGMLKRFTASPVTHPQGTNFVTFVKLARSGAGGARSENDDRQTSGSPIIEQALWTFAFDHQVVEETLFAKMLYEGVDQIMFTDALDSLMERMHKSLWLPSSGRLTACSGTASASATTIRVSSARYLSINMMVDVLLSSTGLAGSVGVESARITGMAPIAASTDVTITIDRNLGAFASVDANYGLYVAGAYNKHPWGLQDIVSSTNPAAGNLGGIDRAVGTNFLWRSPELAVAGPITAKAVADLCNVINFHTGGKSESDPHKGKIGVCNEAMMSTLINLNYDAVRFTGHEKHYQLYGKGVMIGNLPVIEDRFCPDGEFFVITPEDIRYHHPSSVPMIFWWPFDRGRIGSRGTMVPLEAKFSMYLTACTFFQFTPKLCASHGKLTGITGAAPAVELIY